MANNPLPYDATVIASVNTVGALCNSGTLRIFTGSQPALNGALTGTLLVTLTFGSTAFANATASGGIVTANANAITSGVAGNTGTAGYFALVKSDGVTVVTTGTCGIGLGFDLNMTNTAITSGSTVQCSGFSITEAET